MSVLLFTYDWLPGFTHGFVRDMRVRWVLEETGRAYRVATVPVHPKSDEHRAMQPFAQVPIIKDRDLTLFESGAILLHLAEGTALLPQHRRAEVTQWLIAALNSVESASAGWMNMILAQRMPHIFGPPAAPEVVEHARQGLRRKLKGLDTLMEDREWIAGDFSVADIMLADVLRVCAAEKQLDDYPALADYVTRATARPAFRKAMEDHMAHWQAADAARGIGQAGA
ncbi:glutathione S-transferase [Falsochrobactrum shanghaiense]|uniref:Glutathione S-transferase n=1 Tax=Falsochrobactrum shanghaiense TaxID=2201899 RepID=A0A316JAA0_9HYPH|nr:glutathione S-transferase family protein [Falsochrobactrum shanghaiense]PWL18414.1 glutathione S-transferase [Falsochrobactrum shanghaiense]